MGHAEAITSDEALLKKEIIEELDLIDSKMLRIVHSMMRAYAVERELEADPILDYDEDGNSIRSSEFVKEADAIVERMHGGEYITLDDLKKKRETWANDTK